jgi:hypothetical protein
MPRHLPLQVNLRLSHSFSSAARGQILAITSGLPPLAGSPIDVQVLPKLTAHRGKLFSDVASSGIPVHAASFIRRREIVLEAELLRKQRTLRLITVHEIFHFVWARLGNHDRAEYSELLRIEASRGARGELGESSDRQKNLLRTGDSDTAAWKFYVCESFCDTAAWLYAGVKNHKEFTLASRWRNLRRLWFELTFATVRGC